MNVIMPESRSVHKEKLNYKDISFFVVFPPSHTFYMLKSSETPMHSFHLASVRILVKRCVKPCTCKSYILK